VVKFDNEIGTPTEVTYELDATTFHEFSNAPKPPTYQEMLAALGSSSLAAAEGEERP